ncbi:MAG: hypothetical protein ACFFG0_15380 [Candidatus Thorarchaeota archaeon]
MENCKYGFLKFLLNIRPADRKLIFSLLENKKRKLKESLNKGKYVKFRPKCPNCSTRMHTIWVAVLGTKKSVGYYCVFCNSYKVKGNPIQEKIFIKLKEVM